MPRYVLITGSSRGIGFGLTSRYATHADTTVLATCRNLERAPDLRALAAKHTNVIPLELDIDNAAHVATLLDRVRAHAPRLDLLINNAGVVTQSHPNDALGSLDADEMMRVYHTNVVSQALVTQHLTPLLLRSEQEQERDHTPPRIVYMSSNLGSIANNTWGQMISYRCSKSALNQLAHSVAAELGSRAIVLALHPGWVQTDMGNAGGRTAPQTLDESVSGLVRVIDTSTPSESGSFRDYTGAVLPW